MEKDNRVKELSGFLNKILEDEGMDSLSSLFVQLYDGYAELASHITYGDYKPDWSHEDVKKYILPF